MHPTMHQHSLSLVQERQSRDLLSVFTLDPVSIHSLSSAVLAVLSKHMEDTCSPYILRDRSMNPQVKKIYKSGDKRLQDSYEMSINELLL